MSLFQIRDTWTYKPAGEEECGIGCLSVANINNADDGKNKIICGGYSGLLHIYFPVEKSDSSPSTSEADDVLLETNLQNPILQIGCGNFVSSTAGVHLAVLHPRLLVVYKVFLSDGSVSHGKQCKLDMVYQHKLDRTAASMTWGPFGTKENDDFICVQSMDGALTLYEHETFMFTRFIPSFVLPGPLVYNSFNDSFVTISSSNFLESYSYQSLAVASENQSDSKQQNTSGGKRLSADWSLNIGESAVDITIVRQESNKPAIMVLGDRCLFCVEISGKMRFMKKFDCVVACYKVMSKNQQAGIKTIVATHSQQLLIFCNARLQWAAQLFSVPICIEISEIKNIEGTLVLLQDNFEISCSYLGTTPSLFTLPRSQNRAVEVDEIEKEINHYRNQIKDLQFSDDDVIPTKHDSTENNFPITVSFEVSKTLDRSQVLEENEDDVRPSTTCQIKLNTTRSLTDVQISLQCPPGLKSSFKQTVIPSLVPSTIPSIIRSQIQLNGECLPPCLDVEVSICYNETDGSPRVMMNKIELPITMVVQSCTSPKKLEHKVTLETSIPCVDLTVLFDEFVGDDNGPNMIGMQYIHGPKATILTSKSNHRYRIQCEEYPGLWIVVDSFVKRLTKHYPHAVITCSDTPCTDHLYDLVDRHFEVRKARSEVCVLLEQRSRQHRCIQRRLLSRFKDKTPSPLNCLDSLLEGTHEQLLTLVEAHTDYQQLLVRISSNLVSVCLLLSFIAKFYCGWSGDEHEYLHSALWTGLLDLTNDAMGWEESVILSINHLLRTKAQRSQTTPVEVPKDTVKLKKHLSVLFDRLCKDEKFWSDRISSQDLKSDGKLKESG